VTSPVECQACHKPIRSATSLGRRIGGRCWRKLRPDQRALMRRLLRLTKTPSAAAVRRALNQPLLAGDGQLPLEEQEHTP
jgi:hypothetical protein